MRKAVRVFDCAVRARLLRRGGKPHHRRLPHGRVPLRDRGIRAGLIGDLASWLAVFSACANSAKSVKSLRLGEVIGSFGAFGTFGTRGGWRGRLLVHDRVHLEIDCWTATAVPFHKSDEIRLDEKTAGDLHVSRLAQRAADFAMQVASVEGAQSLLLEMPHQHHC